MSLRDKILEANDVEVEIIEVSEWGTKLGVKTLTGRERAAILRDHMSESGMDVESFYPALLVATVVDPKTQEKVFDAETDVEKLKDKSGAALEKVAQVAIKLAGLNPEAVDEAGKGSTSNLSAVST